MSPNLTAPSASKPPACSPPPSQRAHGDAPEVEEGAEVFVGDLGVADEELVAGFVVAFGFGAVFGAIEAVQVFAPAFPAEFLNELDVGGEGEEGIALPRLPFVLRGFDLLDVVFAGFLEMPPWPMSQSFFRRRRSNTCR
jgi:hypothetical protein